MAGPVVCQEGRPGILARAKKDAVRMPCGFVRQRGDVQPTQRDVRTLGAVVIGKIRDSKDEHFGFNADTGEYVDLVKAGVIDPAKVTRLALQNAASIAGLMLTTEALVAELKEDDKKAAAAGGPGGPGGMGGMY